MKSEHWCIILPVQRQLLDVPRMLIIAILPDELSAHVREAKRIAKIGRVELPGGMRMRRPRRNVQRKSRGYI
jgi:hypothetical protein